MEESTSVVVSWPSTIRVKLVELCSIKDTASKSPVPELLSSRKSGMELFVSFSMAKPDTERE